jgi:hypothetical protein
MTRAARYLARAVELESLTARASHPTARAEWESMAASYRKLAELIDPQAATANSTGAVATEEEGYMPAPRKLHRWSRGSSRPDNLWTVSRAQRNHRDTAPGFVHYAP